VDRGDTSSLFTLTHARTETMSHIARTYQTAKKKVDNTKVSPRGRRDDMPPADGGSTVAKIAADLRPSADGSAVRTSLVVGGG